MSHLFYPDIIIISFYCYLYRSYGLDVAGLDLANIVAKIRSNERKVKVCLI